VGARQITDHSQSAQSIVLLGGRELGFSAAEVSKKLGVSQPSVSISLKRGERIAKAEQLELVEG